jgi:CheY-like chemotaxis protein
VKPIIFNATARRGIQGGGGWPTGAAGATPPPTRHAFIDAPFGSRTATEAPTPRRPALRRCVDEPALTGGKSRSTPCMEVFNTPTRFHIFIVDDNVGESALLLLAFKRLRPEASVYTVSDSRLLPAYLDAKSPIQTLRNGLHPHILVLPASMPFYTGFETLAWVRGMPRFARMFVVMLGALENPAESVQAKAAGADAFHVRLPGNRNFDQLAGAILLDYDRHERPDGQAEAALAPDLATA